MPWTVAKNDSGKWCVFKRDDSGDQTGDALGCHDTEQGAKDQVAALYASEPAAKVVAVRMVDGADDTIEGWGMPFGGPFGGQDLYGEHFTAATDFALSWFPDSGQGSRPLLFHHALDADAGATPVGRVKSFELRADIGMWTQAQLDKSSEYFAAIKEMVKAGRLFFSSGAMAHLVDVDKRSGEIKRWPWVELSLTPTPANLLATVDMATASRHFKSAGLVLPEAMRDGDAAAKALTVAKMQALVEDLDMEMTKAEMQDMLDGFPDHDEDAMRKMLAARKKMGKSADAGRATPVVSREQGLSIHLREVNTEAFWSHVDKGDGEDAHWLWTGARNAKGYGILEVDGETVRAHRVAWEMEHGAIPSDKDVGHKAKCSTTSCVRYSHLELVTNQENADERAAREAAAKSAPPLRAVSWEDVGHQVRKVLEDRLMMASPFDMGGCVCIEATFSDHIIACIYRDGEDRYFSVPFTLDDAGNVATVGEAVEMEETFVPKTPPQPVGMMAWVASRYAASLAQRTKDLSDRRLKEGRVLSSMNRERLTQCVEAMGAAMRELQSLLDSTVPQPAKAATVRRQVDLLRLFAATLPQN